MTKRRSETEIDESLRTAIQGIELGDTYQARSLHRMFKAMLTESEAPGGKWWLTEYGRTLLAEMHGKLSQCPEQGKNMVPCILKATRLTPVKGDPRNLGHFWRDLRICQLVLEERLKAAHQGKVGSLIGACRKVADLDEFSLSPGRIRNIYYEGWKHFRGRPSDFIPDYLQEQMPEQLAPLQPRRIPDDEE